NAQNPVAIVCIAVGFAQHANKMLTVTDHACPLHAFAKDAVRLRAFTINTRTSLRILADNASTSVSEADPGHSFTILAFTINTWTSLRILADDASMSVSGADPGHSFTILAFT